MARLLARPHAELRARVLEVLSARRFAYRPGLERRRYRDLVLRWLRILADEGLTQVGFPAEVGGSGDVTTGIAVFETVAFHDLSLLVKLGVQCGLFGGAVAMLGTERHRDALRDASSIDLLGCFAMTETGHGSNVRDIRTVARFDPETHELVIDTPDRSAWKDYIGNAAAHARVGVVFAQLEVEGEGQGVHAVLVPLRDGKGRVLPGIRIEDCGDKLGLNGVDNGRIAFEGVRVSREALLDRFADIHSDGSYASPIADPSRRFFTMLSALVQGRVSVAAASVSAAKSALTIAVRYGAGRRQFGPPGGEEVPVLDYLAHQRQLMPALATTYALHVSARHLVAEYGKQIAQTRPSPKGRRRFEALAAGLKAMATAHATETIQACREACGGQGYLAENRLAALKADTDVFTTFEGDNTVLLQLVARSLLTDHREEFGDLDLMGTMRYVSRLVVGRVSEAFPRGLVADVLAALPGRDVQDRDLEDRATQLELFRFRERHMLEGLGRRLKGAIDGGRDPFDAFVAAQDHVIATALAHVEREVLERFATTVERTRDRRVATALGTLCDLFALSHIERDRGWFQEHNALSATDSKAVVRLVNRRCGDVRAIAVPLVDAFGIPDALLAAPIATSR